MFKLYDRVFDITTKKACFIIDIDDNDGQALESEIIYGLESEDQDDTNWFRWAESSEIKKLPEHNSQDDFWS